MWLAVLPIAVGALEAQVLPVRKCEYDEIPKTVFRKERMFYTVGLEHTGHHLWSAIADRLTLSMARQTAETMFQREESYASRCEDSEDEWLNKTVKALESEPVQYLSSCSYPCGGKGLVIRRPDITFLARVAEKADVDLRLLVMTRQAVQIVNSFHRHRVAMLYQHCVQLKAQLLKLDPRFFYCAPYHFSGSPVHVDAVSKFIGVNVSSALAINFHRSRRDDTEKLLSSDCATQILFSKLDMCSRRLDAICRGHPDADDIDSL